ncbi:MAG: LacI family DNA-binding transcriptional regulator [Eubacteriales bacterium]|nr:LacI family DNA-binding transcriptional regulator [Eubacteriales bacterium]
MVTIGQIAKMAGVSKSTVSRVINNNGYVHEETRCKVEEIMEQYHYRPSASAQNLSRRETNTIGVIVPELDNTFFGEVLSGVAEVIDRNNMTMIVCNTNNDAKKEREALEMMEQQRVRGVIFTAAVGYSDAEAAKSIRLHLKHLNVPVVLVDREIENVQWDGVYYENFESGYLAAEYLIRHGNRRIGIITGDMELKHARERYRGYVQALEDYNIPLDKKYVYYGDFTLDTSYMITRKMIQSCAYPEALVLSNNRTTLGFIKGVNACGQEFGSEIQVVGIDHIPVLDMIGFSYDCVTRDTKGMGRRAMELLLDRFQEPEREKKIYVVPCIMKTHEDEL